jgi:hypothetical protein
MLTPEDLWNKLALEAGEDAITAAAMEERWYACDAR